MMSATNEEKIIKQSVMEELIAINRTQLAVSEKLLDVNQQLLAAYLRVFEGEQQPSGQLAEDYLLLHAKKTKISAKRRRRKRNKAANKRKLSWRGYGFLPQIMMVLFGCSLTLLLITISLVHPSDGSKDKSAPALPPSPSLRAQGRRMQGGTSTSPSLIEQSPMFSSPNDGSVATESNSIPSDSPTLTKKSSSKPSATLSPSSIGGNQPATNSFESTPPTTCINTLNWSDRFGDGCDWYEENVDPGCPKEVNSDAGEMGAATFHCCYCGGGRREGDITQPPTVYVTTNSPTPCVDTVNWNDGVHGCDWYEENDGPGCPKYGDLFGENVMGLARDHCCFCKRDVVALVTPSLEPSSSTSPSLSVSPTSSECANTPNWYDLNGNNCVWYEVYDDPGCPNHGGGFGEQSPANDNCCYCKGDEASPPIASSPPDLCEDTPGWEDKNGRKCEEYERNDDPQCPNIGDLFAGEMGVANDHCCYCKNPRCGHFEDRCLRSETFSFCNEAASACCGAADDVKIIESKRVFDDNLDVLIDKETVGLFDECKCAFWLRLCEDQGYSNEACDYAAEYCCGDYSLNENSEHSFDFFPASPFCYCDFITYAKMELGHTLKTKTIGENFDLSNACSSFAYYIENYIKFAAERPELEFIYTSLNGDYWTNNEGWMNNETDHCEWYGVLCDEKGFVTGLNLRNNNLAGKFPKTTDFGLGYLLKLKTLDIAENKITGTIEYPPLYNLRVLTHFDVSGNQLSGEVNALLAPSLEHVNFSNNSFTSMKRFEKYQASPLKTLRVCDVSHNTIQQDASDLFNNAPPNIEQFSASDNRFQGTFPSSMDYLPNLRLFNMASNALSGALPSFAASFATLQVLDLSNQRIGFTGEIPSNIWRCLSLTKLYLGGNKLEGNISPAVGSLASLEVLDLSRNLLSGSIPLLADTLRSLDLSNNNLAGLIPFQIGQLRGSSVHLKENRFVSPLAPLSLCKLLHVDQFDLQNDTNLCPPERNALNDFYDSAKGLEWTNSSKWIDEYTSYCYWKGITCDDNMNHVIKLQLSNNGLSGMLSKSIGSLTFLKELDLSDNDMKGRIPTEIGLLSNLTYLRLSYNAFTGSAPAELGEIKSLQLLQLQSNRITEIASMPRLNSNIYHEATFIADCGVPSAFDEAVVCKNCTMCCNLNEDCYPQEDTKVSKMGLSYLTFALVIFGCLFILFGITYLLLYLIKSKRGVVVTRRSSIMRMRDEKYALGMIGSDSVYMYFVAKSKAGWFVALTTIVLQVWMLIPFLRASEVNLQDDQIDVEFTWKCPRDSDTCENKGDLNAIGWSIFGVLMATFLSKDLINGIKLIRHSAKTRHSLNSRIRYFFGGVILCFITLFILYVTTIYNKAIATSNTDIIVNSVVILFIMEIDERIFSALGTINERWITNDVVEREKNNAEKETAKGDSVQEMKDEIAMLREAVQKLQELHAAAPKAVSLGVGAFEEVND